MHTHFSGDGSEFVFVDEVSKNEIMWALSSWQGDGGSTCDIDRCLCPWRSLLACCTHHDRRLLESWDMIQYVVTVDNDAFYGYIPNRKHLRQVEKKNDKSHYS